MHFIAEVLHIQVAGDFFFMLGATWQEAALVTSCHACGWTVCLPKTALILCDDLLQFIYLFTGILHFCSCFNNEFKARSLNQNKMAAAVLKVFPAGLLVTPFSLLETASIDHFLLPTTVGSAAQQLIVGLGVAML